MARIALDHVEKVYGGGVKALDDLNLEVREGEFMVRDGGPAVAFAGFKLPVPAAVVAGKPGMRLAELLVPARQALPSVRDIAGVQACRHDSRRQPNTRRWISRR